MWTDYIVLSGVRDVSSLYRLWHYNTLSYKSDFKTLSAGIVQDIHMSQCCSDTEVAVCEPNGIMGVSPCVVGGVCVNMSDTDAGRQKQSSKRSLELSMHERSNFIA